MIKRLYLRQFKVFRNQKFAFPEGITAIVGPNGSGKTTILEAIEFALFRQVSRKEKTVKRMEDLIEHNRKNAHVELEFIAPTNRKRYTVIRKIHIGKTTAELFIEGNSEPIAIGPKKVDKQITELLGMDRHSFSALIYVRQGEIDSLTRLNPSKRRLQLYNMMGLGIYDKTDSKINERIKSLRSNIGKLLETRKKLEEIREHLPTREEVKMAMETIELLDKQYGSNYDLTSISDLLRKVMTSVEEIEDQLASSTLNENLQEFQGEKQLAEQIRRIVRTIPEIAEEQLRPHIRKEAREIFKGIFGDKYSDLDIDENYEICLYDLQGRRVSLMAASGGEDVCVNFALRVAVNTALQRYSLGGEPPHLLILDEPGAGLDYQRRRWLPQAISGLESVNQVIVVTHMDELRESADHLILLEPQGKGRQPRVVIE